MKNEQEFINEVEKIKLQNKELSHQLETLEKEKNTLKMKTCKEDEQIKQTQSYKDKVQQLEKELLDSKDMIREYDKEIWSLKQYRNRSEQINRRENMKKDRYTKRTGQQYKVEVNSFYVKEV